MRVVIRTDSSSRVGTGHLMRCLALADRLKKKGATVFFICRELPGNQIGLIVEKGYKVIILPFDRRFRPDDSKRDIYLRWLGSTIDNDVRQTLKVLPEGKRIDWLVVDHYALDESWEKRMRPYVGRIMVIDDLADRQHDCDLLLDQNLYPDQNTRYDNLVPDNCEKLLGVKYALFREEFLDLAGKLPEKNGRIKKLLVFFGGVDGTNETGKTVKALKQLNKPDLEVDIIIGAACPHQEDIRQATVDLPGVTLHGRVANMAEMLAGADLAIGAGGMTTWERCFMGLPSMVIILAENQEAMTETADERGVLWNLGWHHQVTSEDIAGTLDWLMRNPEMVREVGLRARQLFENDDGKSTDVVDYLTVGKLVEA